MDKITKLYDIQSVANLLEKATGHPVTSMDVRNLSRKGHLLYRTRERRGVYNAEKVLHAVAKVARRRLAAAMGRVSPRFLPAPHSRKCFLCGGIAAEWRGQVLCERGHTYEDLDEPI